VWPSALITTRDGAQNSPLTHRTAHRNRGIFIHRLAAGQITETWTSFDDLGLLRQLGVIPAGSSRLTEGISGH